MFSVMGRLLLVLITAAAVNAQAPQPSADAKTIGKAKLALSPVELLGGRLMVRVPLGATIQARQVSIMAAPESAEHESRVVFDAGEERLVLMVHESFALAGQNFERDVKEWVARWGGKYKIEPLRLPINGLKAVAVTPMNDPDHSRGKDATFVDGIFVESADRTIQSLDVFVNAAAEKDLKGCKTIARQILLSVERGKRKLQLAAGERRLFAYSEDLEISMVVPKDTVSTMQAGPDFLVHRLTALGRLGSDAGSMLIYIGGHPGYEPGAKKGKGLMFGKEVEWRSLGREEGEGLQTLSKLPIPGNRNLNAHIVIRAPNDSQLQALREAAGSLKLAKRHGSEQK